MTDYTGESAVDYFFHHDGMGSIVNITGADETLMTTYDYGPFGDFTTTYHNGAIDSPFTYTGREFSAVMDMFHYRARNYMPDIGRFMSRDPYPYNLFSPNTIQRYNYCGNSAVNFVDPWGMDNNVIYIDYDPHAFTNYDRYGLPCIGNPLYFNNNFLGELFVWLSGEFPGGSIDIFPGGTFCGFTIGYNDFDFWYSSSQYTFSEISLHETNLDEYEDISYDIRMDCSKKEWIDKFGEDSLPDGILTGEEYVKKRNVLKGKEDDVDSKSKYPSELIPSDLKTKWPPKHYSYDRNNFFLGSFDLGVLNSSSGFTKFE